MRVQDIDLTDPMLFSTGRDAEVFATLRREAPVHWHPAGGPDSTGFWVVSRYRDVVWVLRHPEVFSSEHGNILPTRRTRDPMAGLMTFTTDPPIHTKLRALIAPTLVPRSVLAERPIVARVVSRILDALPVGISFDFISEVAGRLPIAVTCSLIGVPEPDLPWVVELALNSHGIKDDGLADPTLSTVSPARRRSYRSVNVQLLAYFSDLVAKRRHRPAEDIVSKIAHAEVNGQRLTDDEIVANCFAMVLGGYQADSGAMGGGIQALVEHPDQFRTLVETPSIVPTAVEEILRWTTPTLNLARRASSDTEVAGTPIRSGERVSAWLISANRDEEVFENPYRFSLTRRPNRHVTFGSGTHVCVGLNVARLELAVILDWLVASGLRPELAGEPTLTNAHFKRGLERLPLRLVPRPMRTGRCSLATG